MGLFWDIVIVALLAALIVWSIKNLRKSSCSGSCSSCGEGGCSGCSGCSSGAVDKNAIEQVKRQVEILKSDAVAVCCKDVDCSLFERADHFQINFVKDGRILGSLTTSTGLTGTVQRIEMLKSCTVNDLICTGIGAGALHRLEKAGIRCHVVSENSRDAALQSFMHK